MAQGSVKKRLGVWVAVGLAVVAAGCTEPERPQPAPPPPAAEAPPPPPVAPPAPVSKDSCGAEPLQYLVGRARTEIPVPVNPSLRRVVCSTCVVTQDFNPGRQTIVYDAQTGLVQSVKCG